MENFSHNFLKIWGALKQGVITDKLVGFVGWLLSWLHTCICFHFLLCHYDGDIRVCSEITAVGHRHTHTAGT